MCQTCPANYDDIDDCMMCWLQYYGINCQNSYSSSVVDPSNSSLSYYTIKIGSQVWMASNYKRRAGVSNANVCYTPIETNDQQICYRLQLGVFYSWAAIRETNFCPTGWHMPSLAEMQALLRSITDYDASTQSVTTKNGILSFIANTALWKDYPNQGKDMRGFRPVPAGYLVASGSDTRTNYGTAAYFWTSESDPNDAAKARVLVVRASATTTKISIESLKKTSLASARCVKDY